MTLDPRLTPARPDLAAEHLRGQVAAPAYQAGTLRRVAAGSAPLRRHPAPDAPLDTEALRGEALRVYDEEEGWAWVQLESDGYVGYVPAASLGDPDPAPTHRVASLRCFVFPGPSLKLPPLDHLSLGAAVTVVGEEGAYARLETAGFIYRPQLAPIGTPEPDFVAVAEKFVRTPYLWGGKTSLGIDCSGLVQTALAAAGIAAPRDSDMQEASLGEALGHVPDFGSFRRGDLVFWKGHVGLMLDAERLLHANAHHMEVVVEPLREAESRIREKSFGPITSVRRLPASPGPA